MALERATNIVPSIVGEVALKETYCSVPLAAEVALVTAPNLVSFAADGVVLLAAEREVALENESNSVLLADGAVPLAEDISV